MTQFDRNQAEAFLKVIDPEAAGFTFQAFDDSPHKRPELARVFHASIDGAWDDLCRLSRRGAGIFVTINETDLKGRKASDIVRVRALFADLDGAPLTNTWNVPLAPGWITRTSEGRYHVFWRVADIALAEFTSHKRKKPGNGANGEDHAADPESLSLADEIKAAKRTHRQRTGNGAGEQPPDGQIPPYGMAESAEGGESSKAGEDPARAKHDSKSDKEAFLRLSKLSRADYDRVRVKEAEALGIRPPTLDKEVEALRPKGETKAGHGRALNISDPEPWVDAVDASELLDTIEELITRFIVCDSDARTATALWIACTWFEEAAQVAPILNIQSPEKRCGKTMLLSLIAKLVKRALPSSNISGASIYRVIEECSPTLVIDEADAFLNNNEEARGIVDSGHTRDAAFVIRVEGDDHTPMKFSTWGFKALSGIGKRAATIEDRSIIVSLKRKAKDERIARLRHAPKADFVDVARKLARLAKDQMAAFSSARPDLPEALNDRAQDNWEHLFAIADIAGGHWPDKAKQAALSLSGAENEEPSQNTALLSDIRDVFDATEDPYMRSADLVAALVAMPERPWGECNHGKALTQNGLARRLNPFGVRTGKVGPEAKRAAGYSLESFADPFSRYIPGFSTGQPDISRRINELGEKPTGQPNNDCPVVNGDNALNSHGLSDCPDENPVSGESGDAGEAQGLAAQGIEVAKRGHDRLRAVWAELPPAEREAVGGQDALSRWKIIAARADQPRRVAWRVRAEPFHHHEYDRERHHHHNWDDEDEDRE